MSLGNSEHDGHPKGRRQRGLGGVHYVHMYLVKIIFFLSCCTSFWASFLMGNRIKGVLSTPRDNSFDLNEIFFFHVIYHVCLVLDRKSIENIHTKLA